MKTLGLAVGILLLASVAYAQPYTVGMVLDVGFYQQVEPLSGFGFERVNQPNAQRCGIGFGGTVEVIWINPVNAQEYAVQYTPTNNANGVLNECSGSSAYFTMTEDALTKQDGIHDAVVAHPPQ